MSEATDAAGTTGVAADGRPASWGMYVTWDTPTGKVPLSQVRDALTAEGFGQAFMRDMLPRNAFKRAARRLVEMERQKLVRFVAETDDQMVYQFTGEELVGEGLEYRAEDRLRLSKATGQVTADDPDRQDRVNQLMEYEKAHRDGSLVSAMVNRLFRSRAGGRGDLFALRRAGGVYLAPHAEAGFVEQVGRVLQALGGKLTAMPATAGDRLGDRAARDAVAEGMHGLIEEYEERVAQLSEESGSRAVGGAEERLAELQWKLECYDALLESRRDEIAAALDRAKTLLAERLATPGDAGPAAEPADEPAGVAA